MLKIKKVIITKTAKQGTASVILNGGSSDLILNKFIVDITDGCDPIKIPTYDNTPIIDGELANSLKLFILKNFNKLKAEQFGIFEITSSGIKKLGV